VVRAEAQVAALALVFVPLGTLIVDTTAGLTTGEVRTNPRTVLLHVFTLRLAGQARADLQIVLAVVAVALAKRLAAIDADAIGDAVTGSSQESSLERAGTRCRQRGVPCGYEDSDGESIIAYRGGPTRLTTEPPTP
jgi:hypothetical protein